MESINQKQQNSVKEEEKKNFGGVENVSDIKNIV